MKKILLFLTLVVFGFSVFAQNGSIVLRSSGSKAEVTKESFYGFNATFAFDKIESEQHITEKGTFSEIIIKGTFPSGSYGEPSLPVARQMISIPQGATPKVNVLNYTETIYSLDDFDIQTIYPQQPSVRKDMRPEDIKFVYDEKAYTRKGYAERPIAEVEVLGNMRAARIATLTMNPIVYDASTNTIKVRNNVEVEVVFENADRAKTEYLYSQTTNPYFATIYNKFFNKSVYDDHPDLYKTPVRMLVIAHRTFEETLKPWLQWKTEKGFYLDVNYTDEIGTSYIQIRDFVHGKYNAGVANGTAPTFLILVGDVAQIPGTMGNSSQRVTDLYYSSVDGDYFPEMFCSRMSVETTQQLASVIEKTLIYEKYTMADPTYLNNVLLIAGADGYWNPRIAQPTIKYATQNYFNAAHGYSNVNDYLTYPYTGCYNHLSTGVGFANYTAHGSETSWADPSFTSSNVNSLTNVDKYFLAMGNCCVSGFFGYSVPCFGEAMIRADKKGAFAYIGSCPNTYWYEDYYFGVGATNVHGGIVPTLENTSMGTYDAMFMEDAYNTVSSVLFSGNLAVTHSHSGGYQTHSSPLYYWQAYHVLGDGSVMQYLSTPKDNTVQHNNSIPAGQSPFNVKADAGSYVAISKDGVLLGTGVVDSKGSVDVTLNAPITAGGNVRIVVTAPQHKPYIKDIPVEGDNPNPPVTNLTSSVAGNNVTLNWNKPAQGGEGDVTVILQTTDVWGDGSGYQLLLDADAVEFGQTIPVSGAIWNDCNAPATLYDVFEYKAPENADPVCTTLNMVCNNQVSITIPAGTYDYCIVNPTPNSKLWIAAGENGRKDDYVFESGKVYHFLVEFGGFNDMTTITVSDRATGEVLEVVKSVNNNVDENVRSGKGNVTNTVYTAAPAQTRALKGYKIYRDGTQIAEINNPETLTYTDNGVANGSHNYCVEAVYDEGAAPKVCIDVTVGNGQDCNPATNVQAVANNSTVNVTWNAPAAKEVVSFNFDAGDLAGWTNIDADGDGNVWVSSATPGIYHNPGVDLTGNGHNGSAHFVISGSYANQGGVLTPDNYFVAPQKYAMGEGSSISFWVCAQDANYPAEHFGVAVSTTGNTNAADFTTIKEWTLTANGNKSVNANATREGNGKVAGVWYQVSCDLSAYAGQEIWIAIRHFNVSDQFIINLDDVEITTSGGNVSDDYTYTLTRNGEVIKTGLTVTSYADNNVPNGTYSYCVKVVYSDCTSASACAANVVVNSTGIDAEEDVAGLRVYPNPATEILNVEGNNIKDIVLYNSLGQTVKVGAINGQINVSNLSNGVYYLVVVSNDGKRAVEKIVIAK